MAVAFDAKATTDAFATPALTSSSPVTLSTLTIGASATALLATVTVAAAATTIPVVTGVTWNAVSMSLLGSATQSDSLGRVYVFGLGSPTTGNHNLVVSFTSANSGSTLITHCASFTGTDTSTANAFPTGNVLTDASTPAGSVYPAAGFTVTTASGDMAVGSMSNDQIDYPTLTAGTIIFHDSGQNDGLLMWGYNAAVGSTTSFQFSGGGSTPCCGVALRVAQPAGGGLTLNNQQMILM
jgi:hypothetical protein